MSKLVLPLDSSDYSLDLVGGKGLSLAGMAANGFPVPAGFSVTTEVYMQFVEQHNLQVSFVARDYGILRCCVLLHYPASTQRT